VCYRGSSATALASFFCFANWYLHLLKIDLKPWEQVTGPIYIWGVRRSWKQPYSVSMIPRMEEFRAVIFSQTTNIYLRKRTQLDWLMELKRPHPPDRNSSFKYRPLYRRCTIVYLLISKVQTESKFVHVLNSLKALRQKDVWESRFIGTLILGLGTRWSWVASRPVSRITGKTSPVSVKYEAMRLARPWNRFGWYC
jgi:hypothetical protein